MVYRSLFRTVGSVLAAAGVKLGPRDLVQPDLGAMVSRGMVISVNRAVKLRVDVDGRSMLVWSPELPVQEVLQAAQVTLGPMDPVSPSLNQLVAAGTVIKVSRVTQRLVAESYPIPVPVQRTNDQQMEMGQSQLVREGTPGEGQRLLMVAYVNGNPVHQLQISDTVLRSPQSAIMAYGNVTSASRGGQTFHFRNTLEVLATAYSARQGRRAYTGALCQFGEVAVDPRVIPLGTRLYIDGYGYATAEDIGSAIKGNRVDLFFESNWECDRWGLRRTKVYILDD
jgi:3D (Asp-Asp-Asp) domain-containing protein